MELSNKRDRVGGSEQSCTGQKEADSGRGCPSWKEATLDFPAGAQTDRSVSKLQVEGRKIPENTWMTSIFSMTHETKLSAESEGAGITNRSSEAC